MKKWLWIGAALLIAVLATAWWWMRSKPSAPVPRVPRTRRLDLPKLRADTAARIEQAKQLARHPAAGSADRPAPFQHLHRDFIDPQCWLGPREICDAISDLVSSCDTGEVSDCVAVAQYIADTPPRLTIGIVFVIRACQLGDKPSCDRWAQLKVPYTGPCEQDVFACSRYSVRDLDRADEACSLGAADSCAIASGLTKDRELSRAYIETGCQLGSPILCHALALSLSPGCVPSELRHCYPPDPAEAKLAEDMACMAGWTTGIACP